TLAFGVVALMLAIALGAIHAVAPGHGKSVMAAYLVGQRGSIRQAGAIGLTVTATHTAGVLVLGLLLSSSTAIVPERLYPLLGFAYGLGMAGTLTLAGLVLVRARSRLDRRPRTGLAARLAYALPVLSASVVCVVGLALAVRAAIAI